MKNMNILSRLVSILLVFSLCTGLLSGCFNFREQETIPLPYVPENEVHFPDDDYFGILLDELFAEWVTNDALTMNYFLADPYRMGIMRPATTFGEVSSPAKIARDKRDTQELSERLDDFEYNSLREDQKIIYDMLRRIIELSEVLEREEDFSYYTGYIRPLIGIQVQLPVLLAEFNFYTAEDIERYLDLIGDTKRYFEDMIEFERERSRRGFFLSDYNVDSVVEQIESFVKNRGNNLLLTVFDYRIDNYPGLSDEQREQYKQRNRDLVIGNVLPAYDALIDAMKELRGEGAHQGGLADLPGGKEYAYSLLRLRAGTDRSVSELESLLFNMMETTRMTITDLLHGEHHQMLDEFLEGELGQIEDGTPKSYISMLQKLIAADFPLIDDTRLVVLEVHESLQEHMSPAFYLAPAIDRFNDNVVYVNPASIDDNLFLFTVLAHESYPGHMYQTVYFLQQSPHPLRTALSNTGYSEGWATYAEMRSYFYPDFSHNESVLMWSMRLFDMLFVSLIDLGVNITGWTYENVVEFLEGFGITENDAIDSVYGRVTGNPLNSLNYSLGYIEMIELINDLYDTYGYMELIDCHRMILDLGPAPYSLIRKYLIP